MASVAETRHGAEALADWKQELARRPPAHDAWFGYAELCLFLGDEAEYRPARRDLLAQFGATTNPDVAERTARACLLLPPPADELRQAVALVKRTVAVGRSGHEFIPYYRFTEGLALSPRAIRRHYYDHDRRRRQVAGRMP